MYFYKFLLVVSFTLFSVIQCSLTTQQPPTDEVRVPLFIAPLSSLPQPRHRTSVFYKDVASESFFSKVTMLDVYENTNLSVSDISNSSVYRIFYIANRLYVNGVLKEKQLFNHHCGESCYMLDLSKVMYVTHYNLSYLRGNTLHPITVGQLHNAIVRTLEYNFCFTMEDVEDWLGFPSFNVTEYEWESFVLDITWSDVRCRSDILVVTISEMAELVRRNESKLLNYNLDMLENDFIPAYNNITIAKSVLHKDKLGKFIQLFGYSLPLYYYVEKATGFTVRDIEILYHLDGSQVYALKHIDLENYLSCDGVAIEATLYNISQQVLAIRIECRVALVLSRSTSFIQLFHPTIGNIMNLSVLEIFTIVSGIRSWIQTSSLLDIDYDAGLYFDAQRLSEIVKYTGITRTDIQSLSVPQIIATYLFDPTTEILVKYYQPIFRKMLTTYGFTVDELLRATQVSMYHLQLMNIINAHRLILDTLNQRYRIGNTIISDSLPYDVNYTSTLPSSEWPETVATYMNESFSEIMTVFFGNLLATSDGIRIEYLPDDFQSIRTTDTLMSSFFAYNITEFTSCLFSDANVVKRMNFSEYHNFYNYTIANKIKKKITFETKSLQSILADRGKVLEDIVDEKVMKIVSNNGGLSRKELRCMYGLEILNAAQITWREVKQTKLCKPFLDRSLLNITLEIIGSATVKCDNDDDCVSSPCHHLAVCSLNVNGNIECKCMPGYTGDGWSSCTDVNKDCNVAPCHPDANCVNLQGTYTCSCKPGFSGDGYVKCEDENECQNSPCHTDANCINRKGSYLCSCKNGFVGNGVVCAPMDVDECNFKNSPCHTDAKCMNTQGSYLCFCKNGFTGNGVICKEITNGDDQQSSGSNVGVIVGAAVGGGILLLLIISLLIIILLRRKSASRDRSNKAKKRKQEDNNTVENAAYEPDLFNNSHRAQGQHESPDNYTQLDNTKREPVVENYEKLRQPQSNAEHYEQLNSDRSPKNNNTYAALIAGDKSAATSQYNAPGSVVDTSTTNEPIYEELP